MEFDEHVPVEPTYNKEILAKTPVSFSNIKRHIYAEFRVSNTSAVHVVRP